MECGGYTTEKVSFFLGVVNIKDRVERAGAGRDCNADRTTVRVEEGKRSLGEEASPASIVENAR